MAAICYDIVGENESTVSMEPTSRTPKRRRRDLLPPVNLMADVVGTPAEPNRKRRELDIHVSFPSGKRSCKTEVENYVGQHKGESEGLKVDENLSLKIQCENPLHVDDEIPKFGMTSVCGRRRDMEDAVSIHPGFSQQEGEAQSEFHYFGIYDGHGCSHVAFKCRDRLHEIVKQEIESNNLDLQWKETMVQSFAKMDQEVQEWSKNGKPATCRCELQTPQCDAVGSTAVVSVVTPDKIIVSNCGDSRAVLCRNGVAIPLSTDHKPDRPDELARIEAAGGRVIYWDGPRVLGVLAMSRAIGDSYLKPYVIPDPEVTIIDRTAGDECLILASDGLWDVVSNDTACGVARMCINAQKPPSPPKSPSSESVVSDVESSDKTCSDASILLTKLALARQSSDNVSVVVVDLRRKQHQVEFSYERKLV